MQGRKYPMPQASISQPGTFDAQSAEDVLTTDVQDRLTQTEQQYHAIFAATSDGLVINDMEGNVVEVNPAFCKMHGYTREEMIAMKPTGFVHPNSHHLLEQFFETVSRGERFHCQ